LVVCVRSCIFLLLLLICPIKVLADWQSKTVGNPNTQFSQFSVQSSENFPIFTVSCVSAGASLVDMLQIDRLTRDAINVIERIEIQVDDNITMIFYPDQHKMRIGYSYYSQLESGIETVTLTPADDAGLVQFAEMTRQFIDGYSGVARVIATSSESEVQFSLLGFTREYLSMRSACLNN